MLLSPIVEILTFAIIILKKLKIAKMKKIISLLILLLYVVFTFAQFKADDTKNINYTSQLNTDGNFYFKIEKDDTTYTIITNFTYSFDYICDEYFVISESCGTSCQEQTVVILIPVVEYRHYDYPYYCNYKEHYFIKRNQDRNSIQAVDFLTGKIFWSRTLTNKNNTLQVESLTVDVRENTICITFADVGIFLNPDNLIEPYEPNKTYTFKLPFE